MSFVNISLKLNDSSTIEGTEALHDDWKEIHVFHGLSANDLLGTSYSQAGQDKAILSMLNYKTKGYFIDLAANEARYLSNSYLLEQYYSWTGICIEANSMYWEGLSSRKCQVVAAAVGSKTFDNVEFRVDNGALGGLVNENFDNKNTTTGKKTIVSKVTVTLAEILKKFNAPSRVDYFSFDVEGAEEFILSEFPFNEFSFTILSIERPNEKLKSILHKNNYIFLKQITDFGETIWINANEISNLNLTDFYAMYPVTYTEYKP